MGDNDKKKAIVIGVVVVLAIVALVAQFSKSATAEKEKVVGTLPMPEGGGRDAEGR